MPPPPAPAAGSAVALLAAGRRRHDFANRLRGVGGACQEQTQIISAAKGRPTPRAPLIVSANAESKFVSNSRPDMTHYREPPRALLDAQRMNDQKKQATGITGTRPVPSTPMLGIYG